ncbi:unnamed protein product [Owenia fusiformis]|uniref:Uncharacterized protein n=1 Tax=Owenia fusiformis TaxID=6347 RepID=A0A8J1TSG1_OWEFU|nr:unnamed protein product [Owenia fusiformis]
MRNIHMGLIVGAVCCIGLVAGMLIWHFTDNVHQNKKLVPANVKWLPERELRGVWVATVNNIDWPDTQGDSTENQKKQMTNILDLMVELNLNALFFQIRPVGDAFYNSNIEPWSKYLTGEQGKAPTPPYDPLEFVVEEGHKRNIQVHAWFNPYRANMASNTEGLAPNHMAHKFQNYTYPYGKYLWMDPGASEVTDHLINVVTDVLNRYDIDGVHMDDYFYPYPVRNVTFPDNETYQNFLNTTGRNMTLEDWRRRNIDQMVVRLFHTIRNNYDNVTFSISPFGIYRPGHPEGMPNSIKGFDPYSNLYADAKRWLQSGWVDILIPQIYWEIKPPDQSYPVILDWWLKASNERRGRHVYAGNALYKLVQNNWNASEILQQIQVSRDEATSKLKGSLGNVHFSFKNLKHNHKNITSALKGGPYRDICLPPTLPHFPDSAPAPPRGIHMMTNRQIMWSHDTAGTVRSWTVYQRKGNTFVLYAVLNRATNRIDVKDPGIYAVKAMNKISVESSESSIEVKP